MVEVSLKSVPRVHPETGAQRVGGRWAGACRCPGEPPVNCDDVFVSFSSPKDGDTVAQTLDVTVTVSTMAGAAVDLDSATLQTRLVSGAMFSDARNGTVTSGQAVFSGVTLEVGDNLLKATVIKK